MERGDTKILLHLAENEGAEFSRRGLARLSYYAKTDDELRRMLSSKAGHRRGLLSRAAGRLAGLLGRNAAAGDAVDDPESGDGALLVQPNGTTRPKAARENTLTIRVLRNTVISLLRNVPRAEEQRARGSCQNDSSATLLPPGNEKG